MVHFLRNDSMLNCFSRVEFFIYMYTEIFQIHRDFQTNLLAGNTSHETRPCALHSNTLSDWSKDSHGTVDFVKGWRLSSPGTWGWKLG